MRLRDTWTRITDADGIASPAFPTPADPGSAITATLAILLRLVPTWFGRAR
jgi:hypothetical protein